MYAVIRAGGKQYRVAPGDVIRVETQEDKDGKVEFGDVLAVSAEAGSVVPAGAGALVTGEVVEQGRGDKILVFHYKRKKQYKKLRGHRQDYTAVRITEIAFDGQSFKAPELPKKEKKVKPAAEGGEEVKTSKRPGKKAAKPAAHAHRKSAAKKVAKAEKEVAVRFIARIPGFASGEQGILRLRRAKRFALGLAPLRMTILVLN